MLSGPQRVSGLPGAPHAPDVRTAEQSGNGCTPHRGPESEKVMSTVVTNRVIRQLSALRFDELNDARKLGKMPLREAGQAWLETRKPFLDPRTIDDYEYHIQTLVKFFGNVPLEKLANPD